MSSSSRHDPRLLFSVPGIHAYHIEDGEETALTAGGPQVLSLLLVPTATPQQPGEFERELEGGQQRPSSPEEDFYLHLNLPPELDVALPATTQIFHQPPSSYIIPRWDLGPEAGAFTRIKFPAVGRHGAPSTGTTVSQDDVDTFETILAQCTAFMEKAPMPGRKEGEAFNYSGYGAQKYDPSEMGKREGYVGANAGGQIGGMTGGGSGLMGEKSGPMGEKSAPSEKMAKRHGQIVLVDEENGSVVGELGDGFDVDVGEGVYPGSKTPVEIQMPTDPSSRRITVRPVSDEYLSMVNHPAYKDSRIVQNAGTASRLIVAGSTGLSNMIAGGANTFAAKTKPTAKPMTFSPVTQERVRKLNNLTHGAVGLSAATLGAVGRHAQNLGATIGRRGEAKQRGKSAETGGVDRAGRPLPPAHYRPGVLNKSMIAFSTIADGVAESAKLVLGSTTDATSQMVKHRYGDEAGTLAGHLVGGVRNVGLVYVDATGVTRKAVIKGVAKGMVVGRMPGGQNVVVGDGDGGQVPGGAQAKTAEAEKKGAGAQGTAYGGPGLHGAQSQFGATAPPPYSAGEKGAGHQPDAKYR